VADCGARQDPVHLCRRGGGERHAVISAIGRLLGDRYSATGLDLGESGGAVGAGAGKDDANRAGTEGSGSASEERVDGRAVAVLARAAGKPDAVIFEKHVMAGRGDVEPGRLDGLAITGVYGVEAAGVHQNARQKTAL